MTQEIIDHFAACFAFTLGAEGLFSNDPSDSGNWTGGKVNSGVLKGTKYGISAASYPNLDIEKLSEAEAQAIYRADFWPAIEPAALSLPVALVAFDAAVNNCPAQSVVFLQAAVGAQQDGILGPKTLERIFAAAPLDVAREALARRMVHYTTCASWGNDGMGWTRRVVNLAIALNQGENS